MLTELIESVKYWLFRRTKNPQRQGTFGMRADTNAGGKRLIRIVNEDIIFWLFRVLVAIKDKLVISKNFNKLWCCHFFSA